MLRSGLYAHIFRLSPQSTFSYLLPQQTHPPHRDSHHRYGPYLPCQHSLRSRSPPKDPSKQRLPLCEVSQKCRHALSDCALNQTQNFHMLFLHRRYPHILPLPEKYAHSASLKVQDPCQVPGTYTVVHAHADPSFPEG